MASVATAQDRKMKVKRGITYSRAFLYTARDGDGVQIPLDAADYTAILIVRKRLDSEDAVLTLTPGAGLTLSTEDDSIRIVARIGADDTADIPAGKCYKYALAITLIAVPDEVTELISDDAEIEDTVLA